MTIKVLHGDCRELLAEIPDASVNLVLTDPPYGVSRPGMALDRSNFWSPIVRRKKALRRDFGAWDHLDPAGLSDLLAGVFAEFARVMKPGATAYVFTAFERLGDLEKLAVASGLKWVSPWVWHKTNPAPSILSLSQAVFSLEAFACIVKLGAKRTWHGKNGQHNHLEGPLCQGHERSEHPCQKPLWLMERLINLSSNPDDLILDPFCGSGSTLVAASRLGRRAIGIEADVNWARVAEERLHQRQPEVSPLPDDLPLFS